MIIAVDLDGVIYNLHSPLIEWHNGYYKNHKVTLGDYICWDMNKPCKDNKCKGNFYKQFKNRSTWFMGPVFDGAIEVTENWVNAGYHIVIVSTVPKETPEVAKWKLEWVRLHLPHINDVILTNSHTKHLIRADILIDDAPHNLETIIDEGYDTHCFLFDQPWNRSFTKARRFYHWYDIENAVSFYDKNGYFEWL